MLAPDAILVDRGAVALHPTLRAAMRLERKHGLAALFNRVIVGSLDGMLAITAECSTDPEAPQHIEILVDVKGASILPALRAPFIEALLQMMMAEPKADADTKPAKPTGKLITRLEFFEELFAFATGSLGWSPATAWNATPAEIVAAQRGRRDLLISIFGSPDKPKQTGGTLAEQAHSAMAILGARKEAA